MLIIHEVMGRNCGWLTAATAEEYRKFMGTMNFLPDLGLSEERRDVHGIFIPEMALNIKAEAARLRKIMDQHDCVNLFVSEGACVSDIVAQIEATQPNQLYEQRRGSATRSDMVADIQNELTRLGYLPAGSADGSVGPKTTTAIKEYQRAQGLLVDGTPSAALLEHMRQAR